VGAGLAGLTAGARAAELGLRVLVLEQGSGEAYPCNSRYCFGIVHAAHRDLKLPRAELEAAMRRTMAVHANDALISAVGEDAARMIDWLRAQGGKFMRNPTRLWTMAPPRPLSTALVWRGRGPDYMLRTLAAALRKHGGELRYGVRATRLLVSNGACTGVAAEAEGKPLEIAASAVVIADGGYQANSQMLRKYVSPHPERLFPRHAGSGNGDGLAMALAAGADGVGLDCFYGHLLSVDAFVRDDLWPYPQLDAVAGAGILVGADGRRRLDEGKGGIYLANGLARTGEARAVVVCDAAIWDGAGRQHQIPPNPLLERHGGTIFRAGTVAELAARCGLPVVALEETIERYNAAVRDGNCGKLDPPRSVAIRPLPIAVPPFIAIPVCAAITNSMGGIAIDSRGRALTPEGTPIAGLYAAGAATGGLDGGPDAGYVGGLVKAVFGLRAAEHAAQRLRLPAEVA
jgi:fumarate reductase flavoprotein subunit